MSRNKRIVVFILFILFLYGCNRSYNTVILNENTLKKDFKYKAFDNENKYVMFALEYNRIGQLEEANKLFMKLYENTSKDEYLFEYIRNNFKLEKYKNITQVIEKNFNKIKVYKNKILKIYIYSLLKNKNFDKAKKNATLLVKDENSDSNYELLANVLLQKGEYKESKKIFAKLYKKKGSVNSLLNLVSIMYLYLNEKSESIDLLEKYIDKKGCDNKICTKLIYFYQEEKNIDGIISVLERTYSDLSKKGLSKTALDRVYNLLIFYLEKKDINKAISFLEKTHHDDNKLLNLYRNSLQYKKALDLANSLYEEEGNIEYLAQIAILEFESARDKKKILSSVIKKFKDTLMVLDNHVYQNYLGYILIDFDIDIKQGIFYVKMALEKEPNNVAYIDSLAWGQYKLGKCKEAYEHMKRVVDEMGLKDEEIKLHWEKIKKCKKK